MNLTKADWRKSSYSSSNGGNCVEVARNLPRIVAVRDSKDPQGPALVFTPQGWQAFLASAQAGEFDLA
jgi:ABC-type amino acid transport substrate-binding protein